MNKKQFFHIIPFLSVRDIQETIDYYKNKLGFSEEWTWGEADGGISRNELALLFNKHPTHVDRINTEEKRFELVWFVFSVDDIYDEFKANGVEIVKEPQDEPWGQREFSFIDINGYLIRVSQSINLIDAED